MPIRPFSRVERPDAQPGHCVRCPRNADLIDFGAEPIRDYGVVYLCSVCLGELLKGMAVIDAETYAATIASYTKTVDDLQEQLTDAERRAAAPVEFVTTQLEEFSNGIADLARGLVRGLASGPARDDRVPRGLADPLPAGEPDLPVEPAAAGEPVDTGAGDDDARATLFAALGFAGGDDGAPASDDAGRDAGDDDLGESGHALDVLYDDEAR